MWAHGRFFVHEQTGAQAEIGRPAFSCGCDAHAELRFLVLLAGRQVGRVSQPVAPAMYDFLGWEGVGAWKVFRPRANRGASRNWKASFFVWL